MNAQTLKRAASQTDPHSGKDPYNTADKLAWQAEIALDFAAWCTANPSPVDGDDNGNESTR